MANYCILSRTQQAARSLNIGVITWRGNHAAMHSCKKCFTFFYFFRRILIPPSPPRLTLLSPGFILWKWIGVCRLVFRTLHSLFTVMLLWFSNGLRANESPAAGTVQLTVCPCTFFFLFFFFLQACVRPFVLICIVCVVFVQSGSCCIYKLEAKDGRLYCCISKANISQIRQIICLFPEILKSVWGGVGVWKGNEGVHWKI